MINHLSSLTRQVQQSNAIVNAELNSILGVAALWWDQEIGKTAPPWAMHHIKITQDLEKAVWDLKSSSIIIIPQESIDALKEGKKGVQELAARIDATQFLACSKSALPLVANQPALHYLKPELDGVKLSSHQTEWHLHLGLLMSVYQRTQDQKLKEQICFLAFNYLYKVAPICPSGIAISPEIVDSLLDMMQLGIWDPGISYNRESNIFDSFFRNKIKSALPSDTGESFVIVDSLEIDSVIKLHFFLFNIELMDQLKDFIANLKKKPKDSWGNNRPILIDCTSFLEGSIYTDGDREKEETFKTQLANLKSIFHNFIEQSAGKNDQLKAWLLENMTFMCKCKVKGVSLLKMLPIFSDSSSMEPPSFNRFLSHTGLRLNSVTGRTLVSSVMTLEELVNYYSGKLTKYSPMGANSMYFKDKLELVEKELFVRLRTDFKKNGGYLTSLGFPTLELIKGCLTEISQEKWISVNADLDRREIVQTCLFRICLHLSKAEIDKNNFVKFAQHMELIHYELITLLTLFEPFNEANFSDIYLHRLEDTIPTALKKYFSAGLTKSAMNTLTGIQVAKGPDCQPVFTQGIHFEIMDLIGVDRNFDDMQKKEDFKNVDLYLGEFNHNISLFADNKSYTSSNPSQEIALLLSKRAENAKPLTVAIDCTIDYLKSKKAKKLLEQFTQQITDGKLNIIFYQSGQKFWLMGMDHVYGSPFYMINNGDPKWDSFNILKNDEAFKSDSLSHQWFCLTSKYALSSDSYRNAIFQNTRTILDRIPEVLLPENKGTIRVSRASEEVESCFIDVKCFGPNSFSYALLLQEKLYSSFVENEAFVCGRGGYGYFHTNLVKFMNGYDEDVNYKTLRITVGINPQENKILLDFFQQVALLMMLD